MGKEEMEGKGKRYDAADEDGAVGVGDHVGDGADRHTARDRRILNVDLAKNYFMTLK